MKSLSFLLFICLYTLNASAQEEQKLSIFFDYNSDEISIRGQEDLDALKFMDTAQLALIKIESYTDRSGTNEYNKQLAKRRSESVMLHLSVLNPPSEINIIGEEYQTKDYNAAKFRRVDLFYKTTPIDGDPSLEIKAPLSIAVTTEQSSALVNEFTEFLKDSSITEATIVLSILFHGNSDAFIDPEDPDLWQLFDIMHYNENITAEIRGHVCCGSNQGLSTMRAYAVYEFLTKRSVSPNRLKYKGYDNTIPAVTPELTDADRQKNRRVDVVFHKSS
ncbi:MAG: outer membrane protein OmpA-like peptidoglycan-associated protein [Flavobacteriaceae bacterium]|jgi:outer membrane protein OmpA-like peptidoglycan-associated protein